MTASVLVAGGAGYVGSAACRAIARAGLRPVVVDNLSTGHRWAVRWGAFEQADIADGAAMAAIMRRHGVSAVMHFAALSEVADSIIRPDRYFHNNFGGTMALLNAMRQCGVDTFVLSSTGAVYGNAEDATIAEDHPCDPINPYGLSKKLIEDSLPWFGSAYGLKWVALRYFNAAGALPEDDVGECHRCESHLIPLACQAALGQRGPVNVMGTDYPTPDGTAIRDYVHVADLADAHVLTLRYLQQGGTPDIFNLGAGEGHSVREIVRTVETQAGVAGISQDAPRRSGDPARLVADCSRAHTRLSWRPRQSDISTIIGSALAWHRRAPAVDAGDILPASGAAGPVSRS